MFCPKCGKEINDEAVVCVNCGCAVKNGRANAGYQDGKGLAIASLVCGIISLLLLPIVTGTLGIIFGGVAKSKGNTSPMATGGIVCGVIGVLGWIIMLAAGLSFFGF